MSKSTLPKTLYIGTMNDAVFVIDTPPRPAPVDYLTAGNPNTEVYAKISDGRQFDVFGKELVARWNAHTALLAAVEAYAEARIATPPGWDLMQLAVADKMGGAALALAAPADGDASHG